MAKLCPECEKLIDAYLSAVQAFEFAARTALATSTTEADEAFDAAWTDVSDARRNVILARLALSEHQRENTCDPPPAITTPGPWG
jgi:hypothetical protein